MRVTAWVTAVLVAVGVPACGQGPSSEEPASLVLARQAVEKVRGEEHRAKMRVTWPALEDETPPDGAEVVIVRGYISYQVARLVLHGATVEAGSVCAARSWFYNRNGESFGAQEFDVPPERFLVAWNAMRRLLAASDERIAPEPEDHPWGGSSIGGSHQSADWIRARARADQPPVHCADRPSRSYDWDHVRAWEGLRDQAIFEVFEALLPSPDEARRPAPVARWVPFAAEEIRASSRNLDLERLGRDRDLIDACLRVVGEAGDTPNEADVPLLTAALANMDKSDYWVQSACEEAARAQRRLRIRLHWDRDDVVRTLRSLPDDTWASEDEAKWIRELFRARDPQGWAEFLVDEATREDARPADVAAAAAALQALPRERSVPVLGRLLAHEDPYVRLEAALALHELAPDDSRAGPTVVTLALDRRIECDWRSDLTNRWSRIRALTAALDWAGLTPAQLRAHLLSPEVERPEFLAEAQGRLAKTTEALSDAEAEGCWSRILDTRTSSDVYGAVRYLVIRDQVALKERMLAALDRIAGAEGIDRSKLDRLREEVEALRSAAGAEK